MNSVVGVSRRPGFFAGVYAVWFRNALVWRKLAVPSVLGNVLDPLMGLLAFGFGLGGLMPEVGGVPYLNYLVCGTLAMSAMHAATFEALYSAFSRMHVQRTWEAIMNTPLSLTQVVLGEWVWAATKSWMSSGAMVIVVAALSLGDVQAYALTLVFLALGALMFCGLALCINAKAGGYDFFMFYFTLCITPMTFLSGAFFPRTQLPEVAQAVADVLPLSLLVDVIRAVFEHRLGSAVPQVGGLMAYTAVSATLAVFLSRKRFEKS